MCKQPRKKKCCQLNYDTRSIVRYTLIPRNLKCRASVVHNNEIQHYSYHLAGTWKPTHLEKHDFWEFKDNNSRDHLQWNQPRSLSNPYPWAPCGVGWIGIFSGRLWKFEFLINTLKEHCLSLSTGPHRQKHSDHRSSDHRYLGVISPLVVASKSRMGLGSSLFAHRVPRYYYVPHSLLCMYRRISIQWKISKSTRQVNDKWSHPPGDIFWLLGLDLQSGVQSFN